VLQRLCVPVGPLDPPAFHRLCVSCDAHPRVTIRIGGVSMLLYSKKNVRFCQGDGADRLAHSLVDPSSTQMSLCCLPHTEYIENLASMLSNCTKCNPSSVCQPRLLLADKCRVPSSNQCHVLGLFLITQIAHRAIRWISSSFKLLRERRGAC
jgi:hypothetical protein